MTSFAQLSDNGEICNFYEPAVIPNEVPAGFIVVPEHVRLLGGRIGVGDDGEFIPAPANLVRHGFFERASKQWVVNFESLYKQRFAQIDKERIRRNFLPITYTDKSLDADATAQNNLSNKLQEVRERVRLGIPMPPELLVWKGEDNVVHVWEAEQAYLDWLAGFAIALSERGTRLYGAAWAHKAAIGALTTVEDILAYDVAQGWD